jgi:D-beta-D-heptose 7-phosphate kinase / D-beta-D-heptose 1-phosphate adenosyltransferase
MKQFQHKKVLVIGDLMLDVYLKGTVDRICREAPVPIVNISERDHVPGGAANAAINLAAMGAQVTLLTVTGDDREGQMAARRLNQNGVQTGAILCDSMRQTLTKKRVMSDDQLLIRYDYGSTEPLSPQCEHQVIQRLCALYSEVDAVLVSDYGYGILTENIIAALKWLREKQHKPLVVDAKYLDRYRDVKPDAVKPNYQEAVALLNLKKEVRSRRINQMRENEQRLFEITGASVIALTLDVDGALVFECGRGIYRTFTKAVPNSRAVGAGDTYVSALTLALAAGMDTPDAAEVAAAAAKIVVSKTGTSTCTSEELIRYFSPSHKIVDQREELAKILEGYRQEGKRIVLTNGCFDILHRGHVMYLAQAKELGDILVVAVNSDAGVRRLKGPQRPINSVDDRMHILASLDCVDHVISFSENTPVELIKALQPDVFVKGGDYSRATLPEVPVVEAAGGKVEILPYVLDRSTSAMIRKIQMRLSGD